MTKLKISLCVIFALCFSQAAMGAVYKCVRDGKLLFSVGYTNKDYILSWILAFGDKAKVVSPPELAEEVKQIAENIVKSYERT